MKRPRIAYKENSRDSARLRKSYTKDFSDIYINGSRKKDGLGESNEEKLVLGTGKFIPGKIYTFEYDPLYKNVLDYYDRRPIILCNGTYSAGTGNEILQGINLNFLPEKAKVETLDIFYKSFESTIKQSYNAAHSEKVFLNVSKIVSFFTEWLSVLKIFGDTGGAGYEFAYRNYIISRVKNLRYVEYDHWEMIPFLNPQEITGASISDIYNTYWKTN